MPGLTMRRVTGRRTRRLATTAHAPGPSATAIWRVIWQESLSPPTAPIRRRVTVLDFAEEALTGGPDAAAAILAGADPGPGSAVLLGMLDPARVTPASMVGVIAATEKLASWMQALQHRWLAAFTVPGVAATREGLLTYAS